MSNPVQINEEILSLFIKQLHGNKPVRATLVVKSKTSSVDFTYYIVAYNRGSLRRMVISMENSYNSFTYAYAIFDGVESPINYTKRKNNPKYAGAIWLLNKLYDKAIDKIIDQANLYNTGKCIKCNRTLTDATSIALGMGKICRTGYNKK